MRIVLHISKTAVRLFGLVVLVLCSCSTTKYVPVETVRTEVVKELAVKRDSVYIQDSVFVREANDTVYLTRWHVEYREALRVDTFLVTRTDSVQTVVEVEKRLTRWQEVKMESGGYAIAITVFCLVVAVVWFLKRLKGW